MNIQKLAAFSHNGVGGNPAGVAILETLPEVSEMQAIAAEVGFSETVFAAPEGDHWRVRYFSPESEVPFCGHATIALGATLALEKGNAVFSLRLNEADISVEGRVDNDMLFAALQSPLTKSHSADLELVRESLSLCGYSFEDLDPLIPPAIVNAGAQHLLIALNDSKKLKAMSYDLDAGRELMNRAKVVTIAFIYAEKNQLFHARNAFASGGVLEDPATGAAAAALGGYLREIGWPHGGVIEVLQGEDMGSPSRIRAEISPEKGASIRVSGAVRFMND